MPLPSYDTVSKTCTPPLDLLKISDAVRFLLVLQFLATGSHGVRYAAAYCNLFILLVGHLSPFIIAIVAFSLGSLH